MELILSIYGAILSTALLIYELLKRRKKLSIIIEHVAWIETVRVIITNSGRRPITLTGISIEVFIPEQSFWEPVPQNFLLSVEEEAEPFPITIEDGESISLPLGPVLTQDLIRNGMNARIVFTDSEGKKYSEYKAREYDSKWGTYSEIKHKAN